MVTENKESGKLIEELMLEAKVTSRNGTRVLAEETTSNPFSSVMTVTDEGVVPVWDRTTGREVICLRYLLMEVLKAVDKDGKRRFTTEKPNITPFVGQFKCLLHPDNGNSAHYQEMGLPVCHKHNMATRYAVDQHMKRRHPSAWAVIEQEKKDAKEAEERQFQRDLMSGKFAQSVPAVTAFKPEVVKEESPEEKAPLYISEKDKKKIVTGK